MYTHQQDSEDEDLEDNSLDIDKNGLGSEAPSNYNYGRRRSRAVLYQLAGSYKTNSNDKATKKIHAKLGGANVSTSLFYFFLQPTYSSLECHFNKTLALNQEQCFSDAQVICSFDKKNHSENCLGVCISLSSKLRRYRPSLVGPI